jgi:hypothetical protein
MAAAITTYFRVPVLVLMRASNDVNRGLRDMHAHARRMAAKSDFVKRSQIVLEAKPLTHIQATFSTLAVDD